MRSTLDGQVTRSGRRNPGICLTVILAAMIGVYACNDAMSPTESTNPSGVRSRGIGDVTVTPGVTTLCKIGPGATFQVRVGPSAAPQTVTVNGGSCANVATVNPAAPDDVIVSVAENTAAYYALDHISVQTGTDAARTITGTNSFSFEGAHGGVLTFYNNAVVSVCKTGTNATFQYRIGVAGTVQALSLSDGQCSTIATIPPSVPDDVIVMVSENTSPTYRLDHLTLALGALSAQTMSGTNSVSFEGAHGARVGFFNVPITTTSLGCTYTQGYYKNRGRSLLPSGNFFLSGQSWLAVLETAPKKGDAYYILGHQYIAAVLNAKSASTPANVSAAISSATTYFEKATPGNWSAGGTYSKDQLTGWADLLDAYNSGNTGPGHCGDDD